MTVNAAGAAGANTVARFNVVDVDGNGAILTLSINAAGSFTTVPTSIANNVVVGGNGNSAGLQLVFGLNTVSVVNAGAGFVSAPSVSFTGGAGSGATATAKITSYGAYATSAGWVLRKELPNGRVQTETLIAAKSLTSDGGDDSIFPDA